MLDEAGNKLGELLMAVGVLILVFHSIEIPCRNPHIGITYVLRVPVVALC